MIFTENNSINQANCIARRFETAPHSTENLQTRNVVIIYTIKPTKKLKQVMQRAMEIR